MAPPKETKVDKNQEAKDLAQLLKPYTVAYNRKGKPYLVHKSDESMPMKDILISVFVALSILGFAFYCQVYDTPDMTEVAAQPAEFNFTDQNRVFYYDAHMHVVFICGSCLFLPTIFKLRAIMRDRPAFELRGILFVWNMVASGLSGWGMYYVVPELYRQVSEFGWTGYMCNVSYCWSREAIGIYMFVYQATKCLEWIDTTLLALRKKPLAFLHLFHHIVTMVYCWHAAMYSAQADCSGIWYGGMNLVVHFIMYGYYGIMALNIKPVNTFLRKISFFITIIQTTQMVVGVAVLITSVMHCETWEKNWHGTLFCAGMYGTYLYLFGKLTFAKFALSKSLSRPSSPKKSKQK